MDMSTGSIMLGFTFFASSFGASPLVIGVTASVYRLLYVFFCQVFGRLSDRVSRKKLTQIACLSFAVLQFLVPSCRRLYQLVALFPLTGIVLAAHWPAFEAWIGERKDGRSLVKRVSIFNLFWTGFVNAQGEGTFHLPIPNVPVLVGLHAYFQSATAGTSVNFTNVVDAIVAP